MNTEHNTGCASELMVAGYLSAQGYEVYRPAMTQSCADLIYMKDDGQPIKVQVKTASFSKSGVWHYEQCRMLRSRNTYYTPKLYSIEEIDEVWIVGTHLWRVPLADIAERTSLCLNTDNPTPAKPRKDRLYDPDAWIVVRGSLAHPYRHRLTEQIA